MPTERTSRRDTSHTDPLDALLATGQTTFGWLAVLAVAYLVVRAFVPFALAVWGG